jgi:nucleoside-diphosphate-sugar epimerase
MLSHHRAPSEKPNRVVVLGAAGFVGGAAVRHLTIAGIAAVALGRKEVDLLSGNAAGALRKHLSPGDTLVFVSAKAPCKDAAMLIENVRMAGAVCEAVKGLGIAHLVYVSSDAVYKESAEPLTEASCAEPGSAHGAMHLAREVLLRSEFTGPMAILRPTLIYGLGDPHNGYGPNRFRRLASSGKAIMLFGEGEERRDHVSVEDVAGLLVGIIRRQSTGVLNAVSGSVASFRELAEFTAEQFSPRVAVSGTPRSGPMPHNGYRAFDASAIAQAFPDFRITPWREGVAAACKAEKTPTVP